MKRSCAVRFNHVLMPSNIVFILGLAGSVMNSCLGLKHVYCMYILAQDQNGPVRSNTKDLCFSPTQIYSNFSHPGMG